MDLFYKPDYKGKGIVNLMSSIAQAFNGHTKYAKLNILSPEEIKKYENVVLLVIDGLGYNFLINQENSFLAKHIRGKMDSVFLSTTACANVTFDFGLPPQQTAMTGWFMNLKEAGMIVRILPFNPRLGGDSLDKLGLKIKDIVDEKNFMERINAKKYKFIPEKLLNSEFSKYASKSAKRIGFKDTKELLKKINSIVHKNGKKFLHAYIPEFDSAGHEKGVGSKKSLSCFRKIDKNIKNLYESIKNTNTLVIITADHGLINTPPEKIIHLENYKELQKCLSMPLSGEGRVAYCYVRLSKAKDFEEYIKKNFSKYCYIFRSEELVKQNYFGLGNPNPKLFERIGDYILIMKENYILKDKIEEKQNEHIGHHAGITPNEMLVPLVILKT